MIRLSGGSHERGEVSWGAPYPEACSPLDALDKRWARFQRHAAGCSMSDHDRFLGRYFRVSELGIELAGGHLLITAPEVFDPAAAQQGNAYRIRSAEMYREWIEALRSARRSFGHLRSSFRKPRSISPNVRFTILKRDDFTCQYCGRWAPWVMLEVDHVVAVSRGGTGCSENLITACSECNRGKSDR